MKQLVCEICGSANIIKTGGIWICQTCGCKYSTEDVKTLIFGESPPAKQQPEKDESSDFTIIAARLTAYHGVSTDIRIPDGVQIIVADCFKKMSALKSVVIPKSVSNIEGGAFSDCISLTNLTVEKDNPYLFSAGNCIIERASKALVAGCLNSVIPHDDSVTSIQSNAFSNCSALKSITIPKNIKTIETLAFNGCCALNSITISDDIVSVREHAFWGCRLENLVLPAHIASSFAHNSLEVYALKTVCITSGTSMDRSFCDCQSLMSIELPNTITNIEDAAFSNCVKLQNIIYHGTKAEWNAIKKGRNWLYWMQQGGPYTIHCTDGDTL